MKQINWLGWGLGAAQVLLCAALAAAWLTPQMQVKDSRWAPPQPLKTDIRALLPTLPEAPASGTRQEDQLMLQMQERPLFALSRRPPPPPAPAKKPDEEPAEQDQWAKAKIMGLFDGAVSGAIVQYAGKEQRLLVRQSLGGWTLSRVFDREIELESGGRKRRLPLTRPTTVKAGGMGSALAPMAIPPRAQRGTFAVTRSQPTQQPQTVQPAPVTPAQHSDSAPVPQESPSQNEGASLGGGVVR